MTYLRFRTDMHRKDKLWHLTFSKYSAIHGCLNSANNQPRVIHNTSSTIRVHVMNELHMDFHVVSAAENFMAHRALSMASMQTSVH